MSSLFDELAKCIDEEVLVGLATVVSEEERGRKMLVFPGGRRVGELGDRGLEEAIAEHGLGLLEDRATGAFELELPKGPVEVFFEVYAPPPKLVVVGAVHVAIPLVAIARTLGFRTVVVDARSVFATAERFPLADEIVVRWPSEALREMKLHESTFCVFLSHDFKLDNPGLVVALRSPARYVGALGSRKTHAKRVLALKELGLGDNEIGRIHAPIGMHLGGNRPEEIAVSIAAEIVAARHGLV